MIQLNNIKFSFENWSMNIDLLVQKGEKIGLIGASGSGKSTVLNLLAGFSFTDSGTIVLNGKNHTKTLPYQRPVSMLFQENNIFEHLTVAENMGLGLQPHLRLSVSEKQAVENIAEQVGLADYVSRLPSQLSGGQKQRVALARCLLRNQPILLLDEPFSALDKPLREEMLLLLEEIYQEKQLTIVMVTHQPDELSVFADRFVRLDSGRIID